MPAHTKTQTGESLMQVTKRHADLAVAPISVLEDQACHGLDHSTLQFAQKLGSGQNQASSCIYLYKHWLILVVNQNGHTQVKSTQ